MSIRRAVGLASLVAAIALCGGAAPDDQLARRPGLWSVQLVLDDGAFKVPDSTLCLDETADRRMTIVGGRMRRSECSDYAVARQPDGGWLLRSTCQRKGGPATVTTGKLTGDPGADYEITATTVTTGAKWAFQNGRHAIRIRAHWAGPCPAGQRGGDITVNGRTTNVFKTAE